MEKICDHPAIWLPNDTELLQHSIVNVAAKIQQSYVYFLMAAFGITKTQATILNFIVAASGSLNSQSMQKRIMLEVTRNNFSVQLCLLRSHLAQFEIILPKNARQQNRVCLEPEELQKIDLALSGFRMMVTEACAIVGYPSLKISIDCLPAERRKLQTMRRKLQTMLTQLLMIVRGDPEQDPIASQNATPPEKLLLGVFDAALSRGQNFIIRDWLTLALFPVFNDTNIENSYELTKAHLYQMFKKFHNQTDRKAPYDILYIPEFIREALRSDAQLPSPTAANPPNSTSRRAASSPGL